MSDKMQNFRTRTGEARRIKTRKRILEAAFAVFDAQGVGATNVEDIRLAAAVSRGSFYNYFPTYEGMLAQLAANIAAAINIEQAAHFDAIKDPVSRLCANLQYFIQRICCDRVCLDIVLRVVPIVHALNASMKVHAEEDFRQAFATGALEAPSFEVGVEIGYGVTLALLRHASLHGINLADLQAGSAMMLRAFGMPHKRAETLAKPHLPPLPKSALRQAVLRAGFIAGNESAAAQPT